MAHRQDAAVPHAVRDHADRRRERRHGPGQGRGEGEMGRQQSRRRQQPWRSEATCQPAPSPRPCRRGQGGLHRHGGRLQARWLAAQGCCCWLFARGGCRPRPLTFRSPPAAPRRSAVPPGPSASAPSPSALGWTRMRCWTTSCTRVPTPGSSSLVGVEARRGAGQRAAAASAAALAGVLTSPPASCPPPAAHHRHPCCCRRRWCCAAAGCRRRACVPRPHPSAPAPCLAPPQTS